jgi:uncharacterized protein YxeA
VNKLPLDGFRSICEERQKIIVSRDRGQSREHRANNKDDSHVTHYRIDGVVITGEQNKCDFLLINEDKKMAYLIELKGSDIKKAIDQLQQTEMTLKTQLSNYALKFRIIASKCRTHDIRSSKYQRFKIQKGGALIATSNSPFEEDI